MFVIGNVVVDQQVRDAEFCCDLELCKGACCCVEGWRGAPLADSEVAELQAAFPAARAYLPERNLRVIEKEGLFEGSPGDYATVCVDNRECVFVYFDGGIARCSLERAYRDGKTSWPKPLSCHLYPIRVRNVGREYLHYHELPQCQAGRDRGAREHVSLHRFLEVPLTRAFGRAWFEKLQDAVEPSSREM